MRRSLAAGIAAVSVLAGGAASFALFAPAGAGAEQAAPNTGALSAFRFGIPADGGLGGGVGRGHHELGDDMAIAAKAIGITPAQLMTALESGKSLAQVAKDHNVAVQKVINALVADQLAELAADVKAGRLTQAQADAMKAGVTARVTARVNNTRPAGGFGRGHGGPGRGHLELGDDMTIAAKAIGITQAQLMTALQSGRSLAQVATDHHVAVAKVIAALVADEQAELAAAVKAGTLTQARADAMKAGITERITARVNNTRPAGGFERHGHGGRGPGPGWGGPSSSSGASGTSA